MKEKLSALGKKKVLVALAGLVAITGLAGVSAASKVPVPSNQQVVAQHVAGASTTVAVPKVRPTATPTPTSTPTPTLVPTATPYPTQPSSSLDNNNYYENSEGDTVHSPAHTLDNSVPAGATAQCGDGNYSFSESHRGTCSHHGGVASWL